MGSLRRFLAWNERLSQRLNIWVDLRTGRRSGRIDFDTLVLPRLLAPGLRVLDVGGGKQPLIDSATKQRLGLHVTGLDISGEELAAAPAKSYDATIMGDVSTTPLPAAFDLILSRTVLEHVADTDVALRNLAASLAPGGVMAHFLPCGNAPFAVLNRMLGPHLSSRVLWAIFPEYRTVGGFPAYYDRCTPGQFRRTCERDGLEIVELIPYFYSHYGRFLFPVHALDTARQVALLKLGAAEFAESFTIVARKPANAAKAAA